MMKPSSSSSSTSRPSVLSVALWVGAFMLVYMIWPQRTTVEINLGGQGQHEPAVYTSQSGHHTTVSLEHIMDHDENDLDGLEHHHFASMDDIEHHDDQHDVQKMGDADTSAAQADSSAAGGLEHKSSDHMDGLEDHHLNHIENLEHHDEEPN